MAAELIELGVDVHGVFRQPLRERAVREAPAARPRAHRASSASTAAASRSPTSSARTTSRAGADESYSEGIVDHIRALEGTVVAALVREQLKAEREGIRKVSLRAADDDVDVSVIARKEGGGGHRQAAGFSTEKSGDELIEFLRAEIAAQLERARACELPRQLPT